MMNAVNEFSCLAGFSPTAYYSVAGGLPGLAGGFSAYCVAMPVTNDAGEGHLVGNFDAASKTGWRIYTSSTGLHADVGDGAAVVTLDGADYTGKFVMAQLSVEAFSGGVTKVGLYINGAMVDSDVVTLAAAYAPTVGKVFSVGYDVNAAANDAGTSMIAGFGLLASPALIVNAYGLAMWIGDNAVANSPDGQLGQFYKTIFSPGGNTPASTYLTAYRAMFDNDGAHPPTSPATQQGAGASWAPYISQSGTPVLLRTGLPAVVTARVPWA